MRVEHSTQVAVHDVEFGMESIELSVGVVMFLFACSQLFTKNRTSVHYSMALDCFCIAYVFFYFWCVDSSTVLPAALWSSDISVIFLIASTFYVASTAILRGDDRPLRASFPLLVPPALFVIGFGIYNAIARPLDSRGTGDWPGHFSNPVLSRLSLAAILFFVISIVLCLVVAYRVRKSGKIHDRNLFSTQVIFLVLYLCGALLGLCATILKDGNFLRLAIIALGLTAAAFTLTCSKILYFSPTRPDRGHASVKRLEWDKDSESLSTRLDRLMKKSAPYRDSNLTLGKLARMLGEDPKRLSYHFKTSLSTNFRGYLNELRLKAVCRDLVDKPEETILAIAFENGFNSKSSFNTLFSETYHLTPREYRSRHATAHPESEPDQNSRYPMRRLGEIPKA